MSHNPLQVLMYGWELPPENTGGLGVACYGIAKGLSQRGVDLSFALPRRLNSGAEFMRIVKPYIPGVRFTAINAHLMPYSTPSIFEFTRTRMPLKQQNLYGQSLYEEAQRFGQVAGQWSSYESHSIIHAHDWMTYPAAISSAKKSGRPWVAHIHATEHDRTGGQVNGQIAQIEYEGLNSADRVIAVSEYTKNTVARNYHVPESKIEVVHNGVDFIEFTPSDFRRIFPHDQIVLFVGRLTYQKGVNYLLKAAKRVLQRQPNTVFIVAGTGDMEQHLMLDAAHLGIGQRVVFAGFQNGAKLRSLYQMADAFVMPSVSEPYGLVALEAIASGTPTVISKQSGVSETLSHVHKVDFWDVHKMADAIVHVLRYPGLAKEMTGLAQQEAQVLSWDSAAGKIVDVYNRVIH